MFINLQTTIVSTASISMDDVYEEIGCAFEEEIERKTEGKTIWRKKRHSTFSERSADARKAEDKA